MSGECEWTLHVSLPTGVPASDIVTSNLEDTHLWGEVQSVVGFDRDLLMRLGQHIGQSQTP